LFQGAVSAARTNKLPPSRFGVKHWWFVFNSDFSANHKKSTEVRDEFFGLKISASRRLTESTELKTLKTDIDKENNGLATSER
jgi:hypothetical protein